jgi:DNA adenine methylase
LKIQPQVQIQASPFLKWFGGKSQLLDTFESYFPRSFCRYYEPFVGGGAVFFHLAAKNLVQESILSDSNTNLINCYQVIRDRIDDLIASLRQFRRHSNDKAFFYQARRRFNQINLESRTEEDVEKAALLVFLNRTCFGGLYRVNRTNEFNVPWGRYKNPRILDERNLRAVNVVLNHSGVQLKTGDYTEILSSARRHDFVYLDPPYQPVSPTSSFTSYTGNRFGAKDQVRLAKMFHELDSTGCFTMLSNSPTAEPLYQGHEYRVVRVKAVRASTNSIGAKRGPTDEILVMNY